jgi:hypothetical protein
MVRCNGLLGGCSRQAAYPHGSLLRFKSEARRPFATRTQVGMLNGELQT